MYLIFLIIGLLILPIILVTAIILLSSKKSNEAFEKKLRAIYCYIIILICIIAIIVSVIYVINNLTEILLPNKSSTNQNKYYRGLTTAISTIIICIPLSVYHKKRI